MMQRLSLIFLGITFCNSTFGMDQYWNQIKNIEQRTKQIDYDILQYIEVFLVPDFKNNYRPYISSAIPLHFTRDVPRIDPHSRGYFWWRKSHPLVYKKNLQNILIALKRADEFLKHVAAYLELNKYHLGKKRYMRLKDETQNLRYKINILRSTINNQSK